MGKKSKISEDKERDVNENIAPGMVSTGGKGEEEVMIYDTSLFNQEEEGMDLFSTRLFYNFTFFKGIMSD